jgi:hypothetical protein
LILLRSVVIKAKRRGGAMFRSVHTGVGRHALVLLPLVALLTLWLGVSGLLVFARGDPEAFLQATFGRFSRADAFKHLNNITYTAWLIHSSLLVIAISAVRCGRTDVLAVLLIGPIITLVICLLDEDWSDPNWVVVVGVCTIGWLASTIVGGVYWGLRPKMVTERKKISTHPLDE